MYGKICVFALHTSDRVRCECTCVRACSEQMNRMVCGVCVCECVSNKVGGLPSVWYFFFPIFSNWNFSISFFFSSSSSFSFIYDLVAFMYVSCVVQLWCVSVYFSEFVFIRIVLRLVICVGVERDRLAGMQIIIIFVCLFCFTVLLLLLLLLEMTNERRKNKNVHWFRCIFTGVVMCLICIQHSLSHIHTPSITEKTCSN